MKDCFDLTIHSDVLHVEIVFEIIKAFLKKLFIWLDYFILMCYSSKGFTV